MVNHKNAALPRSAINLFDQCLHQISRLFGWVVPSPERALILAELYLFPMIVLSHESFFRGLIVSFIVKFLLWLYFIGIIVSTIIVKAARNETWRGLAIGKYSFEMIDSVRKGEDGV